MISLDMFLIGLLVVSAATGLTTEAVKVLLSSLNKEYRSNIIAGFVSIVLSLFTGISYVVFHGIEFTEQMIICVIALVFLSWLCAMVGYDKVIQTISQFIKTKKG